MSSETKVKDCHSWYIIVHEKGECKNCDELRIQYAGIKKMLRDMGEIPI